VDLIDIVWRKAIRSGINGGMCVEVASWRKASRSEDNGGACVEVAAWRKASRSEDNGGNCVEVAGLRAGVLVRDSKDPVGPVLAFAPAEWTAFTARLKHDAITD
jgi:hypothetical protein